MDVAPVLQVKNPMMMMMKSVLVFIWGLMSRLTIFQLCWDVSSKFVGLTKHETLKSSSPVLRHTYRWGTFFCQKVLISSLFLHENRSWVLTKALLTGTKYMFLWRIKKNIVNIPSFVCSYAVTFNTSSPVTEAPDRCGNYIAYFNIYFWAEILNH